MELLAGQGPAPEPLGDDADVRPVHPLDHVGLAVLLIDHRRVVLADQLVPVQLLDGVQVGQRGLDIRVRCGVDDEGGFLSHGISFPWRAWPASALRGQAPAGLICRLVWPGSHAGRARPTARFPGRCPRNPGAGALVCGPRQNAGTIR